MVIAALYQSRDGAPLTNILFFVAQRKPRFLQAAANKETFALRWRLFAKLAQIARALERRWIDKFSFDRVSFGASK